MKGRLIMKLFDWERDTAKWDLYVDCFGKKNSFKVCSNCGCVKPCNSFGVEISSNYCPNCGRKMEEV